MDNGIAKPNSVFGRLYKRVWNNTNLTKDTKINVYKAVVLTTLLHGAERYHQRCLRTILNIYWSDFVTKIEILEMSKVTSVKAMTYTQLRWAGHVSRMEDHRLPKIVLFGDFFTCLRDKEVPRKKKIQRHFETVPLHL